MEWILFLIKKVISVIFYPASLSLILLIGGLSLLRFRSGSRAGFRLVVVGTAVLLVSSAPLTPYFLQKPLQDWAGNYANPAELTKRGVKYVVVLGAGVRNGNQPDEHLPACDSMSRLLEGIRLWKGIKGAKLVLSGGSYSSKIIPTGEAMARAARALGARPDDIVVENKSLDTLGEARLLKPLLAGTPFAMVTSATHMRRSVMSFRLMGLDPIPAPCDFQGAEFVITFGSFLPNEFALEGVRGAVHEYMGILWIMIRSQLAGARPE